MKALIILVAFASAPVAAAASEPHGNVSIEQRKEYEVVTVPDVRFPQLANLEPGTRVQLRFAVHQTDGGFRFPKVDIEAVLLSLDEKSGTATLRVLTRYALPKRLAQRRITLLMFPAS